MQLSRSHQQEVTRPVSSIRTISTVRGTFTPITEAVPTIPNHMLQVTGEAVKLVQQPLTTLPYPMVPPATVGSAHTPSLSQHLSQIDQSKPCMHDHQPTPDGKLKLCSSCKQLRPWTAYSNGQLKKNGKRRCQDCILVDQPPTISRIRESDDSDEDEEDENTETETDEEQEKKVEEESKASPPSAPSPHNSTDRHGHAQLCHECAAILHLEYHDSCVQLIRKGYVPTYTMHKKARKGKNIPMQLG